MSEATFNYTIGQRTHRIDVVEKISGSFTYDADSNTFSNVNFVNSEFAKLATFTSSIDNNNNTSKEFVLRFSNPGYSFESAITYHVGLNGLLTNGGGIIDGILERPNASIILNSSITLAGTPQVSAVPVPAAAWLFGSTLVGLVGLRRRQQRA